MQITLQVIRMKRLYYKGWYEIVALRDMGPGKRPKPAAIGRFKPQAGVLEITNRVVMPTPEEYQAIRILKDEIIRGALNEKVWFQLSTEVAED